MHTHLKKIYPSIWVKMISIWPFIENYTKMDWKQAVTVWEGGQNKTKYCLFMVAQTWEAIQNLVSKIITCCTNFVSIFNSLPTQPPLKYLFVYLMLDLWRLNVIFWSCPSGFQSVEKLHWRLNSKIFS